MNSHKRLLSAILTATALVLPGTAAAAQEVVFPLHAVSADGVGKEIGRITAYDSESGLVLRVELTTLSPGPHGFHMHQNASCEPGMSNGQMAAAIAAGGHYDPHNTGKHMGPAGGGHLGDLPVLYVEAAEGSGTTGFKRVMVAPALKVADIHGHAFVIHAKGDNFSDQPAPLGGGGGRVACGVAP